MSITTFFIVAAVVILVINLLTQGLPPYWIQKREKRTGKKVSVYVADEREDGDHL